MCLSLGWQTQGCDRTLLSKSERFLFYYCDLWKLLTTACDQNYCLFLVPLHKRYIQQISSVCYCVRSIGASFLNLKLIHIADHISNHGTSLLVMFLNLLKIYVVTESYSNGKWEVCNIKMKFTGRIQRK